MHVNVISEVTLGEGQIVTVRTFQPVLFLMHHPYMFQYMRLQQIINFFSSVFPHSSRGYTARLSDLWYSFLVYLSVKILSLSSQQNVIVSSLDWIISQQSPEQSVYRWLEKRMVKADESEKQTISFFIEMIIWCNSVLSKKLLIVIPPSLEYWLPVVVSYPSRCKGFCRWALNL